MNNNNFLSLLKTKHTAEKSKTETKQFNSIGIEIEMRIRELETNQRKKNRATKINSFEK